MNGRVYGTPAVAGGRVFVPSSTGGSLTAFSVTGRYLWRVGTGAYVYSSPAAWGGRVFFGSYNGVFYGVSAASGRVLWAVGTGGPISGAAAVVDGVAYAGSFAHRIVGVDARTRPRSAAFGHGHYVPVSGNGMRLLFHGYSRLYAVEPRSVRRAPAIHHKRHLRHDAQMRRAAAGVAAVLALAVPAVAQASTTHDAALARKGITHAVARHWVKPADALRYRTAVTRALRDVKTLPRLRGDVIASQLSQMTPLSDSYTSPRALSLFSQLETNLDYLETHRLPTVRVDVTDDEGVVYRWFPRLGLEFHPLANFGALNNAAATGDVDATRTLADALVARAIPRDRRLLWEYQFRFSGGRPPWASGMAQAVAAQSLARSSALLQDPALGAAAVRAFASVPPFLLSLPSGPWIRLYGFNGQVVLNAQLQAILSLLEYSQTTGGRGRRDARAAAVDDGAGALPALRHRRLVALPARRRLRHARVPEVRHRPAREARPPDAGPVLDRDVAALPRVLLRPAAGDAAGAAAGDLAAAARRLPRRRADHDHALDACIGDARGRRQDLDVPLNAGTRTLTWKPPAGLAAGHVSRAGLGDELRRQEGDVSARAGRRALGHDAARAHAGDGALRDDAHVAGGRSGHPVARARGRPRRPERRQPAADTRSRASADERVDRGSRTARNLAGDAPRDELRRR